MFIKIVCFDSTFEFVHLIQHFSLFTQTARAAPKVPTKSYREEIEQHQRRFLPHQGLCLCYSNAYNFQTTPVAGIFLFHFPFAEMVKGRGKSARQTRNLLLKMSSDKLIGPLSVLKEWKDQQKRVKVTPLMKIKRFSVEEKFYSTVFFWHFPCRYSQEM